MTEHDSQVALFGWASWMSNNYPDLKLMFAIPNGGHRPDGVGRKMKAEGVKPGVPDIMLPVPKQPHHGLFIEMKYNKNKPSPEQQRWLADLKRLGYFTAVCYSVDEAITVLKGYLKIED